MRWIIAFAWALPVVAVTAVLVSIPAFIGMGNSKATGLAALLGTAAEGLLCVGILNVAVGLILWRLVGVWVR
jgi:hypothetical protein